MLSPYLVSVFESFQSMDKSIIGMMCAVSLDILKLQGYCIWFLPEFGNAIWVGFFDDLLKSPSCNDY